VGVCANRIGKKFSSALLDERAADADLFRSQLGNSHAANLYAISMPPSEY
jgi:hypothetical protein